MPPLRAMANAIRKHREARGWDQGTLAKKAGIHRVYLNRLEQGKCDPRVSVLLRIAKALRVTLNDLT